jgi:hypothetical protein
VVLQLTCYLLSLFFFCFVFFPFLLCPLCIKHYADKEK